MGTCQFYKVMYYRGQALTPGIHFFLKIVKFRLPYLHVFDDCETSLIYLLWHDQFDGSGFSLHVRHEKLLFFNDIGKKVHKSTTGHTHGLKINLA